MMRLSPQPHLYLAIPAITVARKKIKLQRSIQVCRVHIATLLCAKKRRYREVSEPREIEGNEKDEGSLGILTGLYGSGQLTNRPSRNKLVLIIRMLYLSEILYSPSQLF
ncbi:hypothetical protein SAMN05518672_108209 [Chitinophaga sp. CF118]|uniref:hypothetical protein n=1 Tax=Chitinophaga sp. CF118 TaxID=1884367 RepID=UPI0008E3BDB2|nr:hypothetical protein [Chitinophaga sp. CF118]SFE64142.1 hypothetical protein SAMN05518672_108209 [Chitinophaga sp. CF118]